MEYVKSIQDDNCSSNIIIQKVDLEIVRKMTAKLAQSDDNKKV